MTTYKDGKRLCKLRSQQLKVLLSEEVIFMVPGKEPFAREAFAQNYEQMNDTRMEIASVDRR